MAWLKNLRRRMFGGTPVYDGTGGGRRALAWMPGNPGAVAALSLAQDELRAKSRDLVRRNAWAAAGIEAFVANAIGTGIKPQSMVQDQTTREAIHSLWWDWCEQADAAGLTDFYGLQALATRAMLEGGEALIRLRYRRTEDGLPVALQIQVLDDSTDETAAYAAKLSAEVNKALASDLRERLLAQGYELAGFAWFQGWNDMVDSGTYPNRDKPGGYDAYSTAMAQGLGSQDTAAVFAVLADVPLAQREEDTKFQSVFIAKTNSGIKTLADMKGKQISFGSQSSTSGHLMPRSFLLQAGLNPEKDFRRVAYSGAHDATLDRQAWLVVSRVRPQKGANPGRVPKQGRFRGFVKAYQTCGRISHHSPPNSRTHPLTARRPPPP